MTYHPQHGNGPSRQWYAPPAPAPTNGGKLLDITKAGLPIGIIGGVIYAVYMAIQMAFAAGQNVGAHQKTLETLQREVSEVKTDLKEIKAALPAIQETLRQIRDRPQWTMDVRTPR